MAAKNTSPPKSKLYPPTHTIPHGAQPDNTRLSLWRLWKHHGFQPHSAGFSNLHAQTGILVEARAEGSIAKAFAASPELSQPREREEPVLQRPSEQTYQLESQLSKVEMYVHVDYAPCTWISLTVVVLWVCICPHRPVYA